MRVCMYVHYKAHVYILYTVEKGLDIIKGKLTCNTYRVEIGDPEWMINQSIGSQSAHKVRQGN